MNENKDKGNARTRIPAYFTSGVWAQARFDYAFLFDTLRGRLMVRGLGSVGRLFGFLGPAVRRHNDYLVLRHHAIEARLRQLRPTCIIEVGSGLSSRGIALAAENPDLLYVEVDLPGMVSAKRRMIRGFRTPPNYLLGPADLLSKAFTESLPAKPRPGDRIVIVTEGVTDYFTMDEKRVAYRNILSLLQAHGGGRYLSDLYAREHLPRVPILTEASIQLLGRLVGRSFDDQLFETVQQACRFLVNCGFETAGELSLSGPNTAARQPPLEGCPFRLVEAVTGKARQRGSC